MLCVLFISSSSSHPQARRSSNSVRRVIGCSSGNGCGCFCFHGCRSRRGNGNRDGPHRTRRHLLRQVVFENRRSAHFLVNATVGRDTDFKKRTGITFFSCKTPPNSFTRLPHASNTDADTVGPTLSHALVDTLAVVSDGNDQLAIPMLQHHLGVACSRMLEHTIQEHRTALNLVPASCRLGWHSTTKDGSNREGLPGLESR
jgi:hypothetical protein